MARRRATKKEKTEKKGKKRTTVYYCHPYTACERKTFDRPERYSWVTSRYRFIMVTTLCSLV